MPAPDLPDDPAARLAYLQACGPRVGEVYTIEIERDRFGVTVHGKCTLGFENALSGILGAYDPDNPPAQPPTLAALANLIVRQDAALGWEGIGPDAERPEHLVVNPASRRTPDDQIVVWAAGMVGVDIKEA